MPFQPARTIKERCESVAKEALSLASFQEPLASICILHIQASFIVHECQWPSICRRAYFPISVQHEARPQVACCSGIETLIAIASQHVGVTHGSSIVRTVGTALTRTVNPNEAAAANPRDASLQFELEQPGQEPRRAQAGSFRDLVEIARLAGDHRIENWIARRRSRSLLGWIWLTSPTC